MVGFREAATLRDWNAHGPEIIGARNSHGAVRLLSFGHGMLFDVKRTDVVASAERKRPHCRNGFDPGDRSKPRHELIEKCDDVFRAGIGGSGKSNAGREKTLSAHAGLNAAEAREGLNQQACANEQD